MHFQFFKHLRTPEMAAKGLIESGDDCINILNLK